jgi:hypothetical protein
MSWRRPIRRGMILGLIIALYGVVPTFQDIHLHFLGGFN